MKYKNSFKTSFLIKLKIFIESIKFKNYKGISPYIFNGTSTLFNVSTRSYIEKQIFNHQNHCGYLLEVLSNFIVPNKTFLDVGSNIGSISLPLANYFKETNFHLFEPDEDIFSKLESNIKLNNLKNVTPNQIALFSSISKKTFFKTSQKSFNQGTGSLIKNKDIKNCTHKDILTETIDSYIEKMGLLPEEICFIKLDVQGLEYEVLKGASNLLMHFQVPILLEYEKSYDNKYSETRINLENLLQKKKYKLYKVSRLKIGFIEKVKSFSNFDGNYLCLPS